VRSGPRPDGATLTVGAYLCSWLDDLYAREVIGDTSRRRYETVLTKHLLPFWSSVRLCEVKLALGNQFCRRLAEGGAGLPTQRLALRVLNSCLNAAVGEELLPANPCARLRRPKRHDREVEILDEAQANHFLDVASRHEWYPLFAVALGTGLRVGELLGLHWPAVDLGKGTVEVKYTLSLVQGRLVLRTPKTKASRRKVRLPRRALEALRAHHARQKARGLVDAAVFCTRTGRLQYAHQVSYRLFHRLLAEAGLPRVRFHALRHTHASILLSRGASLRAVATRLGHRDPSVTLRVYAHVLPNDDADLVTVLDRVFC
jgi:integrase